MDTTHDPLLMKQHPRCDLLLTVQDVMQSGVKLTMLTGSSRYVKTTGTRQIALIQIGDQIGLLTKQVY